MRRDRDQGLRPIRVVRPEESNDWAGATPVASRSTTIPNFTLERIEKFTYYWYHDVTFLPDAYI
jgi:hypothetical protein